VPEAGRDAVQAEGVACYEIFIGGMLDLTDNVIDGVTVTPPEVVCHDEPDPYLVVAADKGTAAFSDIANALSERYGFWLHDAFASGGSVGYNHKRMAITARGAWVAVQRHFRERGVDVQQDPVSVIGYRRHVGRRVRQRHAVLAQHPARGCLRSPAHLR
jgi:glutamate dehydrogenase